MKTSELIAHLEAGRLLASISEPHGQATFLRLEGKYLGKHGWGSAAGNQALWLYDLLERPERWFPLEDRWSEERDSDALEAEARRVAGWESKD